MGVALYTSVCRRQELTKENFILNVNEKMLSRRFKSIQHELQLKDELLNKLQKEILEQEQILK